MGAVTGNKKFIILNNLRKLKNLLYKQLCTEQNYRTVKNKIKILKKIKL